MLKLSARICLTTAVIIGLNACSRDATDPPASPESPPANEPVAPLEPAPATPPVAAPDAPAASTVKPQVTQSPAPKPTTKVAPAVKKPIPVPQPKPATAPATAPTLDLVALENQLKATKAIGVFSKIALKNQVDDLLKQFRDHYKGKNRTTMADLKRSYDLLMMKVLSLIQDDDKQLAAAIVSSRAAIWALLADPDKFAALDV